MWNDEKGFVVELLTNNFTWTANTLGELYKSRWQVEIFLREIKQLLRIKTFIGTSENAVYRYGRP
ncbi:MAG: transposase [Bacteroidales bacterium]|nr:transposase [Bacteroidales bacterium]